MLGCEFVCDYCRNIFIVSENTSTEVTRCPFCHIVPVRIYQKPVGVFISCHTVKNRKKELTPVEISLQIGTRATLDEFLKSYTIAFLRKHGLKQYQVIGSLKPTRLCSVNTKNGEAIIDLFDIITYVGHDKWSVTKQA